ncbi:hypothetical protein J2X69_000112 [Algoriphagus sp. 4150]|uniref:hypothetical protein n=1 Tax=Algoriphagus sp. 4150 TaxID=2817756 RepID=UPI002862AF13|nr:hypothetical protein [Algoriphagus sp. 4150]MDR7127784.1 hypothetical protein [Algoriphagus sp. 4150]
METTAFFIFLFFHLGFLILGFGSVLVTDLYGLLWVRDHVRFTQLISVSGVTQKFIWAGWIGMVAAGIPLAILKGEVDNLMIIKLFFVAIIGINGLLLHYLQKKVAIYKKGDHVPNLFMFRLIFSLFVSQLSWWSALLIGFLHRHVSTVINWPEIPWLVSGLILATLLVIWGAGELLFKAKESVNSN